MTEQQDAYRALRASTLNQMDAARRLVNTYFTELVGEEQAGQATCSSPAWSASWPTCSPTWPSSSRPPAGRMRSSD
ncbi:MAG TPA: hypothetical protein VFL91_27030 [Thermomicrobiales bacterium]|nr:hypothetical protein [Thermomicrobiales bacterium]